MLPLVHTPAVITISLKTNTRYIMLPYWRLENRVRGCFRLRLSSFRLRLLSFNTRLLDLATVQEFSRLRNKKGPASHSALQGPDVMYWWYFKLTIDFRWCCPCSVWSWYFFVRFSLIWFNFVWSSWVFFLLLVWFEVGVFGLVWFGLVGVFANVALFVRVLILLGELVCSSCNVVINHPQYRQFQVPFFLIINVHPHVF